MQRHLRQNILLNGTLWSLTFFLSVCIVEKSLSEHKDAIILDKQIIIDRLQNHLITLTRTIGERSVRRPGQGRPRRVGSSISHAASHTELRATVLSVLLQHTYINHSVHSNVIVVSGCRFPRMSINYTCAAAERSIKHLQCISTYLLLDFLMTIISISQRN
jgi:hypothetical protein